MTFHLKMLHQAYSQNKDTVLYNHTTVIILKTLDADKSLI